MAYKFEVKPHRLGVNPMNAPACDDDDDDSGE